MLLSKKTILSGIILLTGLVVRAQDTLPTKRLVFLSDNKKQTQLDSLVDRTVLDFMQSPQNCGLSIGVSKNNSTYFYNYGEIKRRSNTLPSPATVYEIGSVTTTFCGVLLAQAFIEKKLKPDDDIRLYLPGKFAGLVFNKVPVTLKHLANHTSGLAQIPADLTTQPNFDSLNPYKNYSEKQVYDYLRTVQLATEPGLVYDYSALGMAVLGLILERVYDKPFDVLVNEKMCAPNNMLNTGTKLKAAQQAASGYNLDGAPTQAWDLGAFTSAGGLRSSAADMLAWLNFNLQEKDAATRLAHVATFKDRQGMGLGWFIHKTRYGNTLTWNNGATYGFSSFCGFIKEKSCSVIILSNAPTSVDYIGIAILNQLQQ